MSGDTDRGLEGEGLQYGFLLLLSTAYLAVYAGMQGFLALMPLIQEEFLLTRSQAGFYMTFYSLTATVTAVFTGNIVDSIGSKRGIVGGTISVGAMLVLHALAPAFFVLLGLALITGLVFSIITPSLNKAVMVRVREKRRATSMGIMQSGGGVGGFMGASLLPLLAGSVGWRYSILLSGLFAILMGSVIYIFYRERRGRNQKSGESRIDEGKGDTEESGDMKDRISLLLKNRYLLGLCALGFAFNTTVSAVLAHYTLYLTRDLQAGNFLAGLSLGILHIGGIAGRPLWGMVSDRLMAGDRRRALMLVAIVLAGLNLLFGLLISSLSFSLPLMALASFVLGAAALGWNGLFFTNVAETVSAKMAGIGTGFALLFTRTGGVISPPIFGYIADLHDSYVFSWLAAGAVMLIFTCIFLVVSRKEMR